MAVGDNIKVIRGIVGSIFSIGLGATKVQIKNNAGVVEMRNAADGAFVITRGLDPVGNEDYVTKLYGDTNYAGEAIAEKVIQFSVALITASSTAQIPDNAQVFKCQIDIGTAYDNSATINVGDGTTPDLIFDELELDTATQASYIKNQNIVWVDGPATVTATVGNTPTLGASVVTVWYAEPAA